MQSPRTLLESGLTFGRRNRQTLPDRGQQLSSPNPRFNRLQDSIQRAKEESLNAVVGPITPTRAPPVPRDSMTSTIIASNRSSQRPVVQSPSMETSIGRGANLSSETQQSPPTNPLPLEHIPTRFAAHHLSVTIPQTQAQIISMAKRLVPFDPYIGTGIGTFELPRRQSSETLSWKTSLEKFVRLRHPSDSAAI